MTSAIQDSQSTSLSLLDRVRNNDPGGWNRLAELYGPLVYRWSRSQGLDDADAADIGQEVFQTVFRSMQQFKRAHRGAFRSWLKTIMRTRTIDWWRRKGQEVNIGAEVLAMQASDENQDDTDSDQTDVAFLYQRAMQLIQVDFAEATWKAFVAVVVEERPVHDVARELRLTPNAVYIARSRVLARLRAEFAELIE